MNNFKDFGIEPLQTGLFVGEKIKIDKILNTEITVKSYKIEKSKKRENSNCLTMQIEFKGENRVVFTGATVLIATIQKVPASGFPFMTTIIKANEYFEFS